VYWHDADAILKDQKLNICYDSRFGILLTCGMHLHDPIISLRGI